MVSWWWPAGPSPPLGCKIMFSPHHVVCCRAATCSSRLCVCARTHRSYSKIGLVGDRSTIEITRAVGQAHTAFARFLSFLPSPPPAAWGAPIRDRFFWGFFFFNDVVEILLFRQLAKKAAVHLFDSSGDSGSSNVRVYLKFSQTRNCRLFYLFIFNDIPSWSLRFLFEFDETEQTVVFKNKLFYLWSCCFSFWFVCLRTKRTWKCATAGRSQYVDLPHLPPPPFPSLHIICHHCYTTTTWTGWKRCCVSCFRCSILVTSACSVFSLSLSLYPSVLHCICISLSPMTPGG